MSSTRATFPAIGSVDQAGNILRYTLAERVNHWIAALSYLYVLLTGLAFWSPALFWMTVFLGGGQGARDLHPWFGLLFAASTFWMYRVWRNDMQTTKADLAWKAAIQHYIRNDDEDLPPIDRFNWGQKQFFWVMFYSVIGLLISGFAMWFVDAIPASLLWLRGLAVFIHVVCALLTIGAFIIHVYMGTAMVRGGFSSIIRGVVSPAWARMHHRLWYEEVTGQSRGKSRHDK